MTKKKIIAREWLYLLGGVVAGFGFAAMFPKSAFASDADIYTALALPYVLFQVVRSAIWAVKTLRAKH